MSQSLLAREWRRVWPWALAVVPVSVAGHFLPGQLDPSDDAGSWLVHLLQLPLSLLLLCLGVRQVHGEKSGAVPASSHPELAMAKFLMGVACALLAPLVPVGVLVFRALRAADATELSLAPLFVLPAMSLVLMVPIAQVAATYLRSSVLAILLAYFVELSVGQLFLPLGALIATGALSMLGAGQEALTWGALGITLVPWLGLLALLRWALARRLAVLLAEQAETAA
ncbi:MAG: hypothetical protein AAF533_22150 [Acidobacteriota bacterium]